jgi:hypothetical protein
MITKMIKKMITKMIKKMITKMIAKMMKKMKDSSFIRKLAILPKVTP